MRKSILTVIAAAIISSVNAQEKVTPINKFFDNWYGGVNVGAIHSPYKGGMKPAFGLELGKQITPVLGVSVQGITGINSTYSNNAFDDLNVTLNGKLNLFNLFMGYKGEPRLFEIEGLFGIGFMHEFYTSNQRRDNNGLSARAGASFNFNVGKEKKWTLSLRPAYLGVLDGKGADKLDNASRFELLAGAVYHFECSNGRRHHSVINAYTQSDIDRMNDEINGMRRKLEAAEDDARRAEQKNKDLVAALDDCRKNVKEAESKAMDMTMEPVISFRRSKSDVEITQLPNIENVASFLKNNPDVKASLSGYASPEGNKEFNQKLSEKRAFTVKDILVNKYGIEAERIDAKGMGIGENFSKPEMNRAVIVKFN